MPLTKANKTSFRKGNIPWNKGKIGVQKLYWLGKKRPEIGNKISERLNSIQQVTKPL